MDNFHFLSQEYQVSPLTLELEAILEDTPAVVKCCNSFTGPNPFTSILNHTKNLIP